MNIFSYKELSAPAAEPVTLAQAKAQLVVDTGFTDDDTLIASLITAARQHVEGIMQRSIFNRSMQLNLDYFPYPYSMPTFNPNDRQGLFTRYWRETAIRLPRPRAVSVQSISYVDQYGNTTTIDASMYYVDSNSEPARVVPITGMYWPYVQAYLPGSVTVVYTAGSWGDGVEVNTCPQAICQAMLLLISYWYNHRDSAESNPPKAIENGVDALLTPYKFDTLSYTQ